MYKNTDLPLRARDVFALPSHSAYLHRCLLPPAKSERLLIKVVDGALTCNLVQSEDTHEANQRSETDTLPWKKSDETEPGDERTAAAISAASCGDLQRLLQLGREVVLSAADHNLSTPLMWASGHGHLSAVRALIEMGCDVNSANRQGRSALMWAARGGHLDVVQFLVHSGADLHLQMKDGSRTFDWAVFGGSLVTCEWLAGLPAVDIHATNFHGCSAAHWACAGGSLEVVQWLFKMGVSFRTLNNSQHSALSKAVVKGHRALTEWLVVAEDGPLVRDHVFLRDDRQLDLTEIAQMMGFVELAAWLRAVVAS
eukprot:TRINITY_DN13879_c0_g1_i1.p1 TRINITY_DN13879_c0_g1~~TRINITY_DN13879_c0_g1_i1.p1  ORF type:complete len:312 (-),score=41.52 TRINITY_DN13879_c0_g1_i1:9-944(-)